MKLFSVQEANDLLPLLRQSLARVVGEQDAISQLTPEIRRAQAQAHLGGGSPDGGTFIERLFKLRRELRRIESLGVLVKDYQQGLCDFPHERHGRIVYLCWKPSEEAVRWWHETEAGFAGRQPLESVDPAPFDSA